MSSFDIGDDQMINETDFKQAIIDLQFQEIGDLVKKALDSGMLPETILDGLKNGLDEVGDLYQTGELFLSELYMAGETMAAAMEVLTPALSDCSAVEPAGIVVLGSIMGDIHDFGKNIVKIFLTASGFTVYDLGVDVPPEKFVEKAFAVDADFIGISAILSTTQPASAEVISLLEERGLRDKIKVILGGTGVDNRAITAYGVDAAVNDATLGEKILKKWMEETRR
ncbi:MAG: cobalamin B12-binding domain-containing protein [Promethearchaeota archaeon]|jgi:methylmalonyl-CoA mutase cobalamin-binding domain/chain